MLRRMICPLLTTVLLAGCGAQSAGEEHRSARLAASTETPSPASTSNESEPAEKQPYEAIDRNPDMPNARVREILKRDHQADPRDNYQPGYTPKEEDILNRKISYPGLRFTLHPVSEREHPDVYPPDFAVESARAFGRVGALGDGEFEVRLAYLTDRELAEIQEDGSTQPLHTRELVWAVIVPETQVVIRGPVNLSDEARSRMENETCPSVYVLDAVSGNYLEAVQYCRGDAQGHS